MKMEIYPRTGIFALTGACLVRTGRGFPQCGNLRKRRAQLSTSKSSALVR